MRQLRGQSTLVAANSTADTIATSLKTHRRRRFMSPPSPSAPHRIPGNGRV